MNRAGVLALGAWCCWVAGCSGITDPTLRVVDAQVVERTDEAVVVHFIVEGENKNAEEIPLLRAEYAVSFDGREVFRATRSPEATLRRSGVQRFTLPASVPTSAMGASTARWRLSGSVSYVIPEQIAETLLDIGFPNPTAGVQGEGELGAGQGG